jgi:hypothetical protein
LILKWKALILSQSDPTDHALATIASILEKPSSPREGNTAKAAEKSATASASADVDGYSKTGPGPIAAIRFKWAVRRSDQGEYFVDETLGTSAVPVAIGPLGPEAAVRLVDEREREALSRFERLKSEIVGGTAVADPAREDGET